MRLLVTGAFVRAARSARSSVPRNVSRHTRLSSQPQELRWQSSQSAAALSHSTEAFPEQSVSASQEVDPLKTAHRNRTDETDPARKAFREKLQTHAANAVAQEGELKGAKVSDNTYIFDSTTNLSPSVLDLIDRNLYEQPNHPLCITRKLVESVFGKPDFQNHVAGNPVVTTKENFDTLGFPQDHPGRSRTDTYYVDSSHVLRTHTSAHQHAAFEYMREHLQYGYTICADVYRRDSIDRSHFPVFHQMEGARTWRYSKLAESRYEALQRRREKIKRDIKRLPSHKLEIVQDCASLDHTRNPPQHEHDEEEVRLMVTHLKKSLEGLVYRVFTAAKAAGVGDLNTKDEAIKVRWVEATFPFTSPSFELEVFWQGDWLEMLGSGIVDQPILNHAGLKNRVGWAWGIGIERFAMLLFGIPDIRLFWSTDKRFLSQFQEGKITKFEPFSKYPACYKDISFWVNASPATASPIDASSDSGVAAAAGGNSAKASPADTQPAAFHENDVMEIVRDVGGTLVEDVHLTDEFVHPKTGRKSLCYRINYRSLERTLTNEEVNELHTQVTQKLTGELGVELR